MRLPVINRSLLGERRQAPHQPATLRNRLTRARQHVLEVRPAVEP